jgi:hypothetical protein
MGKSKTKKMLNIVRGCLRVLSTKESISEPNLDLFLDCPLVGEQAEVQVAFNAIAGLTACLARKYESATTDKQFTSALNELTRLTACLKSGQIPK